MGRELTNTGTVKDGKINHFDCLLRKITENDFFLFLGVYSGIFILFKY